MFNFNQDKVFKFFVLILIAAAVGILIREIFLAPKAFPSVEQQSFTRITIDLNLLKAPFLTNLSAFEEINLLLDKDSLLKEFGREDPFKPY